MRTAICVVFLIFVVVVPCYASDTDEHAWVLEIPKDEIRQMVKDLEAAPLSKHE
jgi:type III secretory pathway component EscU